MRDYKNFDKYLDNIYSDIYAQPPDEGHMDYAKAAIDWADKKINLGSVLDIGCGQGFCRDIFRAKDIRWTGVTTGRDFEVCKNKDLPVFDNFSTFLELPDNSITTVFARHILEHSPFPILTLMEWKRVSTQYLVLIYPAYEYWGVNGRNHYNVLDKERLWYNLTRAGWWSKFEFLLMTDSKLFDSHYPSKANSDEASYPGAPIPVEYWYICKQGKERID